MGLGTVLDDFVEEKMLNLNTCFIGKVESVKAGKAKVQPLTMFKTYGGEAKQPAVVEDVPICKNVYKIELYEWEQMPPEGRALNQLIKVSAKGTLIPGSSGTRS